MTTSSVRSLTGVSVEVGLVGPVGYREIGRPWTVDVGVGRLVDHMMCVHVRR